MPDDQLWLDPQRAFRGGIELARAGAALGELRAGLGAGIAADSAAMPWGKDDIGSAFERNYRGFEQAVLSAWDTVASYVERLGASAAQAVASSVETDVAASRRIGDTNV